MNGKPDVLKGSYYANPVVEIPGVAPALQDAYPEYYNKNICTFLFRRSICALKLYSGPKDDEAGVEGFSSAFKDLGRFIFEVGCELAVACQPFGALEVRPAAKFLNIYYSSVPSERFLHVAASIDQHVEHGQSSPSTLLPTESRRRPDRRKRPRGQLVWLAP
jgi:hypothetical protein